MLTLLLPTPSPPGCIRTPSQVLGESALGLSPEEVGDLAEALSPPEERAAHPWGGGPVAYVALLGIADLDEAEADALGMRLAQRLWALRAEGVELEAVVAAVDIARRGCVTRREMEGVARRLGLPLSPEELEALCTRFSRLGSVLSDEVLYGRLLQWLVQFEAPALARAEATMARQRHQEGGLGTASLLPAATLPSVRRTAADRSEWGRSSAHHSGAAAAHSRWDADVTDDRYDGFAGGRGSSAAPIPLAQGALSPPRRAPQRSGSGAYGAADTSPLRVQNVSRWAQEAASPSQRRDMQRLVGDLEDHQHQLNQQQEEEQAELAEWASFVAQDQHAGAGQAAGHREDPSLQVSGLASPVVGLGTSATLNHTVRAHLNFGDDDGGGDRSFFGDDTANQLHLVPEAPRSPSFKQLYERRLREHDRDDQRGHGFDLGWA